MQQKDMFNNEMRLQWNRFLSGDDDAFSKIYVKYFRELFSFGLTFVDDDELVKDCIQDVFFHLYQQRAQLAPVDNVTAFLLVAMKNTLIDVIRKNQVHQKFIESYNVEELYDESEEEKIIAKESDNNRQDLSVKYKSVLTKRQLEVIHYRFVDDLSLEEIAKLLNVNYQSVANIIQRSLKKIRNFYLKSE